MQASDDEFNLCGQVIADTYRIDRVAGIGGFGVVYRATHLKLNCRRAIKCLRLPTDNPDMQRSRTSREYTWSWILVSAHPLAGGWLLR